MSDKGDRRYKGDSVTCDGIERERERARWGKVGKQKKIKENDAWKTQMSGKERAISMDGRGPGSTCKLHLGSRGHAETIVAEVTEKRV